MQRVEPEVYLIAEPRINEVGLQAYLAAVGAPDWRAAGAWSSAEELIEVAGRTCYRSFAPGLNPNVTKVREGNAEYLKHIVKVGHGSVLEHAQVTFVFRNVSRVFTHELVRHRVGVAISQESLRYVRLTGLSVWLPEELDSDHHVDHRHMRPSQLSAYVVSVIEDLEFVQKELAGHFDLDNLPFAEKKKVTSALRRLAPIGLATTIVWSANLRTLRHVIEMRTSKAAEAEVRLVFDEVARVARHRWPNVFADYERNPDGEWVTPNRKV